MKTDYSAVCMIGAGLTLALAIVYHMIVTAIEWFII